MTQKSDKKLTKKLTKLNPLKSVKSKFLLSAIFHLFNLQPLMINKYFKNKQRPPIRQTTVKLAIGDVPSVVRSCGYSVVSVHLALCHRGISSGY